MNFDGQKVMIRTTCGKIITARIETDRQRVFAVLYEYGPKNSDEVIKTERLELDKEFLRDLTSVNGVSLIYKKEIELPDPGKN
jgi:hypothetical protein